MISTSELFAEHFQLGALLGQGGMSDVYRAVDARSGAEVALKIVRSGDPELARRVAQEVRVQQRLSHEGLIKLLDTGVDGGQAYLVMELIDGATLSASLRAEALGARLTAKLGSILGGALAYIHGEGIVHRDVKPSNIMLSTDGRALLGDFGIARLLDATTFTIDGTTIGTIAYMAPEQLEDHQVGPPADIWSLGIVLLECLKGRRIYEGTSSEIIARRLAGPVPLPADLPVPWKLLLSGMLDHRPEHRLTGEQVASMLSAPAFAVPWAPAPMSTATGTGTVTQPLDLTALAPGVQFAPAPPDHTAVVPTSTPVPAGAAPGPPPVFSRPKRRRWWPVAALIVVLALAGTGIALAVDHSPTSPRTHTPPAKHPAASTSTSTTTSTSSTTTTTVPTAPTALATLVQDITSGEDAGTVSSGIGQALTSQAQQAVTDEAHGQPQQAAQDLQQAAITIQNGEQTGALDSSEGSILQNDLNTLAGTLGLSAAATVTTTTTTTGPGPGGGGGGGLLGGLGKHHGNG
ncbi:MAG TPA: serine/threonine-protein kinase [Acidimicrobiales bacterium]|jgi:serine/threonine protein kinase